MQKSDNYTFLPFMQKSNLKSVLSNSFYWHFQKLKQNQEVTILVASKQK